MEYNEAVKCHVKNAFEFYFVYMNDETQTSITSQYNDSPMNPGRCFFNRKSINQA